MASTANRPPGVVARYAVSASTGVSQASSAPRPAVAAMIATMIGTTTGSIRPMAARLTRSNLSPPARR